MKTCRYYQFVFFALIFLIVLAACSNQSFKTKSISSISRFPDVLDRAQKDKRYFIMQSGINIYNITSVDIDRAKQQMTVTLDKVDSSHLVYLKNPEIRRSKAQEGETHASAEIRVYMKDSTSYTLDEPHTIALEKVNRVELLD